MRLGLFSFPSTVDSYVESVQRASSEGFSAIWSPQIFGLDALQCISIAAREVEGMHFGTAVIPTYPRHPMVMAYQALTTAAATKGRFTLGIGLSHKIVIEGMYGYSFEKPARHMREYLSVLGPLLRGESVNVSGETVTARGQLSIERASTPSLMIAAMAPAMLKLAGSVADGTILWMTGPKTTANQIKPVLREAADAAGRATPSIVAGLPMCLTSNVDAARERAAKEYVMYGQLPSYRAMLDAEGLTGPADLAAIGSEATLRAAVEQMQEAGVDDFACAPFGSAEEQAATRAFVGSLRL